MRSELTASLCLVAIVGCDPTGGSPDAWISVERDTIVRADVAIDAVTASDDAPSNEDAAASSPWSSGPALPVELQEISAVTIDDRIWVVGGFEGLGEVSTVRVLDPSTRTWTLGPPLPVARHHVALATLDGDLYVLGGMETTRFTNVDDAWVLRSGASEWTEIAPLPEDRGAGIAGEIDGLLYVVGGQGRGGLSSTTLVYDPAMDTWSTAASIPTRREHLAGFVYDGEIWALGGRALSLGSAMDVVEIYDPATDTWRTGPSLTGTHGGFAAAVVGNVAVAVGGETPERALDLAEAITLPSGAWRAIDPVPTPRHGHAMAAAAGRAWVIGGADAPIFAAVDAVESIAPID